MTDLARLVVTAMGLGLILAVNLYFFARPSAQRRRPMSPPAGATGAKRRSRPADRA